MSSDLTAYESLRDEEKRLLLDELATKYLEATSRGEDPQQPGFLARLTGRTDADIAAALDSPDFFAALERAEHERDTNGATAAAHSYAAITGMARRIWDGVKSGRIDESEYPGFIRALNGVIEGYNRKQEKRSEYDDLPVINIVFDGGITVDVDRVANSPQASDVIDVDATPVEDVAVQEAPSPEPDVGWEMVDFDAMRGEGGR